MERTEYTKRRKKFWSMLESKLCGKREARKKSRLSFFYFLQQLRWFEQATYNRKIVGSSPTWRTIGLLQNSPNTPLSTQKFYFYEGGYSLFFLSLNLPETRISARALTIRRFFTSFYGLRKEVVFERKGFILGDPVASGKRGGTRSSSDRY